MLPQGLSFFAGKPKSMKSFTMFDCCIAVAQGGPWLERDCSETRGAALHLSLEDPVRRSHPRGQLLASGISPDEDISIVFDAPILGSGLARMIERWISSRGESARLCVIDTWAKVRPSKGHRHATEYERDYGELQPLKHLTDEYSIALVLIHHTTKAMDGDPMSTLHGTTGTLGAVDGAYVLHPRRERPDLMYLSGVHKDLADDVDLALKWDKPSARYHVVGSGEDHQGTDLHQSIRDILMESPGLTPRRIVDALRVSHPSMELSEDDRRAAKAVHRALSRMEQLGMARRNGHRGAWIAQKLGTEGQDEVSHGNH